MSLGGIWADRFSIAGERIALQTKALENELDIRIRLVEPAPDLMPFRVNLSTCADGFVLDAPTHYKATCVMQCVDVEIYAHDDAAIAFALRNVVKQLFVVRLVLRGGLALHAASVCVANRAWVFMGPSEVGKTTLCRAVDPSRVLNDELTVIEPDLICHRTPYFGDLGLIPGELRAPLERIYLLGQLATEGSAVPSFDVSPLSMARAARSLLKHAAWFDEAPQAFTAQLTNTCVSLAPFVLGRLLTQKMNEARFDAFVALGAQQG